MRQKSPRPIDAHVGSRTRMRRLALGLSQTALARRIGVSFQAVQKYESGGIRISASRLYDVARVLEVLPGFFFEGYAGDRTDGGLAEEPTSYALRRIDPRDVATLIRGYRAIRDPGLQAEVRRLVATLGACIRRAG
jgi:transcriptional regulator with XRE-family HTH domain